MLFGDIPLVGMLKQRMSWHEQRQGVLAQNVANADTPQYRAKDLKEPVFPDLAKKGGTAPVQLVATDPRHFGVGDRGFDLNPQNAQSYEITPEGNAVVLEEEVLRVSQNVQDYQMVSQLYSRGLGLLKTAVGRRA